MKLEESSYIYVHLSDKKIVNTIEALKDKVYFDVDKRGNLVGVDILGIDFTRTE